MAPMTSLPPRKPTNSCTARGGAAARSSKPSACTRRGLSRRRKACSRAGHAGTRAWPVRPPTCGSARSRAAWARFRRAAAPGEVPLAGDLEEIFPVGKVPSEKPFVIDRQALFYQWSSISQISIAPIAARLRNEHLPPPAFIAYPASHPQDPWRFSRLLHLARPRSALRRRSSIHHRLLAPGSPPTSRSTSNCPATASSFTRWKVGMAPPRAV